MGVTTKDVTIVAVCVILSDGQRGKHVDKCSDGQRGKHVDIRDEDEYIEDSEEQSEDDASEILPKNDKNEAAANSGMVEPAKTQLPCCQGLGSMVDYLAMRERKQKEAASAIATGSGTKNDKVPETDLPDIEMEEVEAVKVPKRLRGKTRMDKVHTRPFEKRVVISMNKKCQSVSDDDKNVSELSRFLGTLKRCVPLTYASWEHVPENLKNTLWNYVKQRYIIPEELKTWSWKTIQQSWKGLVLNFCILVINFCKKNKQPDDEQPDDQQPDDQQPDGEQPDDDLYYAKIFAKTSKRKPGRKYQSNPDVMEFIIDTINKKLGSSEGLDGLDELVSGAKKSHGRGWLIGRHDPKCLKTSTSAPAPTDSYVQELTKKIRQEVAVEVEAKVNQKVCAEVDGKINRKVQDNLTLALKKLAEANPTLNVDIGEICATISSDTVGDGTPMTNGPSS
ncbi:hypothetical protein POM88_019135 [Heracleum sosnowskyi]|uniref:Transposase n=1 Tax=Heracleum sosnowskyi TaxID=360622 RepID=A0AAD8IV69_9APIA|nr:hypothetical protein POM88_019135 [Heracleum sosnowskyi]